MSNEKCYITIIDDGKKKTSEIIAELRRLFPVKVYNEKDIDKEFPVPAKPTSRKFFSVKEAEEELNLEKKSNHYLFRKGIPEITLRERLLFELEYFKMSDGQHLDTISITYCAGLWRSDTGKPGFAYVALDYNKKDLLVCWRRPDADCNILMTRRAIL